MLDASATCRVSRPGRARIPRARHGSPIDPSRNRHVRSRSGRARQPTRPCGPGGCRAWASTGPRIPAGSARSARQWRRRGPRGWSSGSTPRGSGARRSRRRPIRPCRPPPPRPACSGRRSTRCPPPRAAAPVSRKKVRISWTVSFPVWWVRGEAGYRIRPDESPDRLKVVGVEGHGRHHRERHEEADDPLAGLSVVDPARISPRPSASTSNGSQKSTHSSVRCRLLAVISVARSLSSSPGS